MNLVDKYNSMSDVGQAINPVAPVYSKPKQQPPKKKGPGGLEGFLVNNLPAITSGIGAVGGSFVAPFAGTVAGGATGGALGESLKRKILGEKQDAGQIAIQGVEGGLLSGAGKVLKGAKAGAQALTKLGGREAESEAAKLATNTAENASKGTFSKNLTTQGQQAQGRVSGISAGSKVQGRELTPQDTESMLNTLKQENITTGNANNTLRDIGDKMKVYGKQISDHFKGNSAPLTTDDTKVIAQNFLNKLPTTDERVLKEAQVLADDLQKNVKSTRDLWDFRKTLDSRIPDSKFVDDATTNKVAALKAMRQYISDELGTVPGMKSYHDLAEIKPFVSAEARRLNNPGGGIVGRVLSSGPVQKLENTAGKATEAIGKATLKSTPEELATEPVRQNFVQKVIGAAANPLANPMQTAKSVLKQEVGRGFGIPAATNEQAATPQPDQSDMEKIGKDGTLLDTGNAVESSSPYDTANVMANIQAIRSQGGTEKDVAEYLSNVKSYQDLVGTTEASNKPISATAADAIANAQTGLSALDQIEAELSSNPSVQSKEALTQTFNPFGVTGRLTGTSGYDTAITQAKDVIARLRTGAAISNSEEARFTRMLPQPADPPETIAQKLQLLRSALNTVVTRVGGNSSDLLQEAAQAAQ